MNWRTRTKHRSLSYNRTPSVDSENKLARRRHFEWWSMHRDVDFFSFTSSLPAMGVAWPQTLKLEKRICTFWDTDFGSHWPQDNLRNSHKGESYEIWENEPRENRSKIAIVSRRISCELPIQIPLFCSFLPLFGTNFQAIEYCCYLIRPLIQNHLWNECHFEVLIHCCWEFTRNWGWFTATAKVFPKITVSPPPKKLLILWPHPWKIFGSPVILRVVPGNRFYGSLRPTCRKTGYFFFTVQTHDPSQWTVPKYILAVTNLTDQMGWKVRATNLHLDLNPGPVVWSDRALSTGEPTEICDRVTRQYVHRRMARHSSQVCRSFKLTMKRS